MEKRMNRINHKLQNLLRQITKVRAYKRFLESKDGKLIIDDLMNSYGINRTTFSEDARTSAFKEGQRSVVLAILKVGGIKNEDMINSIQSIRTRKKEV